jgi:hypothetical protein
MREDALSLRSARCYLFPISTLAEIEKSVSQFSAEELAKLEQIIRKARRAMEQAHKPSLPDTNPVSVGTILKPSTGGGSSIANRCRDCAFPYLDAASSTWAEARARLIARRDVPRSGRHDDSDFECDEFHGF